jgi:hypothetical protein
MDPISILSLTSACAALAGRTATSLKDIYDFHQIYHRTAANLKLRLSDVENAKHILLTISSSIVTKDTTVLPVRHILETCMDVLREVKKFTEKHKQTKSGLQAHWARVRFT